MGLVFILLIFMFGWEVRLKYLYFMKYGIVNLIY